MAVQPVHRTCEQFRTEALGERIPVELAGCFTLYARRKSRTRLYIHDKRNGPESRPVANISESFGEWTISDGEHERFTSPDPLEAFHWWLGRQAA